MLSPGVVVHELPVTESILDIALRHAKQAGATRITDIHLVIGQLSSIVDESVRFYWNFVSKDTMAEGARLHFRRVAARMACLACGAEYQPDGLALACPACQSRRVRVVAGEEFQVEAIEVDFPDGENPEARGGGG